MTEPVELKPEGKFIHWQKVFEELHAEAAKVLGPGTRYEIHAMREQEYSAQFVPSGQQVAASGFRRIRWCADILMNQVEPWTDIPEETPEHYRVGRYTTPKEDGE